MVQAETGTDTVPPLSVGARLAAARLAQQLDLEEVAQRTRVPLRHLDAIEKGDAAELPAAPYAVGFAKSYARVVGLDAQVIGNEFRHELEQATGHRPYLEQFEPADPKRIPPMALVLVALLLVVVVVGGYAAFRSGALGGDGPEDRAQLAAGTAEGDEPATINPPAPGAMTSAVAPAVAAPAGGPVAVTALEPVWLKIYDTGATLFQGEMAVGQRFDIPATANGPMVWTGRPQALRVTVGDAVIPPLGSPERTIRDVSLAPQALLQRLQTANAGAAQPVAPLVPQTPPPGSQPPGLQP